ncbi:nitroreductase family protein [Microbacterium sp. C7(2022)]|uniref:nitroreductase family protein n=1 Tax=Microbacterium sp. C7(2022) TaxID=2992759 RepID=UPI00237A2D2A|nr:nitroreductase family protein [Microbacterium sp. C7(2022)]MDE0546488.1 nitroreductase family protein [Microbacterium sp. C7(2022)]
MSTSATLTADRLAQTDSPVLDVLAARWSPRAFDAATPIDEGKLASALEAARWAPSANNLQPWRFIVARRGTATHDALVATLFGFNQAWAGNAAALIVAIAETETEDGTAISHAVYDLGQAVAHLSVQAHHDGLYVHQMSGFDRDAVRQAFSLDERFAPMVILAIGDMGDASALPDVLRERETAPRARRPLAETLIETV